MTEKEFEFTWDERKRITDNLDEIAAQAVKFKYDTMEKKLLQTIIEEQQKEIERLRRIKK